VTGRADELGESLESIRRERNLPVTWTYSQLITSNCEGGVYCKGSILASALYEIANSPGQTPLKVGKLAYQALPGFAEDWKTFKETPTFNYQYFIKRIVGSTTGIDKLIFCEKFRKWFDVDLVRNNIGC